MSTSFKKIKSGSSVYYIKVDKTNGAVIIEPGSSSISLSKDTIISMLNFRRSFAYAEAIKRREITGNSIIPIKLDQYDENTVGDKTTLVVTEYSLTQKSDYPEIIFKNIDVSTGSYIQNVFLPGNVADEFFRQVSAAGIKSDVIQISDIQYVKKLPDETVADSTVVYRIGSTLYKLNADQDAFVELSGNFVRVRKLYEFSPVMKENVLYELGQSYKDEFGNEFDRGVYTYTKTGNVLTKTDLVIYITKKLPEVSAAKENYVYLLSKDDIAANKQRGTMWKLNSKKDDFVEETRKYESVPKLPYSPLAVDNTYYILNDERIFKANSGKYDNLGTIADVKELPDITNIILDDKVVYVLVEKDGNKAKGSKWIFDATDKQFVAFTDGYKGHQNSNS